MKRRDLIRHLEANDCRLVREGRSHSIWKMREQGSVRQCLAIARFPNRSFA